jgi:hypothetical protein
LVILGYTNGKQMSNRGTNRQRAKVKLVAVKLPEQLVKDLDHAVNITDSDRSKFTRVALRERIARVAGGAR